MIGKGLPKSHCIWANRISPFGDEKKKQISLIFAILLGLIARGALSFQNRWNFRDISIRSKDMPNFRLSVFLTVHSYLKRYFCENYLPKDLFMLNLDPLEFIEYPLLF